MTSKTVRTNTGYSSGKRYVEFYIQEIPSSRPIYVGVDDGTQNYVSPRELGIGESQYYFGSVSYKSTGKVFSQTSALTNVSGGGIDCDPYTSGDVVGMKIDLDLGSISFYKNNVLQVTIPYPSALTTYVAVSLTNKGQYVSANLTTPADFVYEMDTGFLSWSGASNFSTPEGSTAGSLILESSSTTLTLDRPMGSGTGTYYAFIMHRSDLTLPSGWTEVHAQPAGDLNQVLTLAKAPASVSDMVCTQSASDRFLGQVTEVEISGDYLETISSHSRESVPGNVWADGPSVIPPGNGMFLSASTCTISSTSNRYYISQVLQSTPEDIPDSRLCVTYGNVFNGKQVIPNYYHEQNSTNYFAEITLTITDGNPAPSAINSSPWISRWDGSTILTDNIHIPMVASGTYDFYVDWGRGNFDYINSYDSTKNGYLFKTDSLPYDVKIYGVCSQWSFLDNTSSRDAIKDILQWGDCKLDNCAGMFQFTNFPTISAIDLPDTSEVTDFSNMFASSELQVSPAFDMSAATTVEDMFSFSNINTVPFFNTGSCTNFHSMFNSSDIVNFGGCDTSNADDMSFMFYDCDSLTSVSVDTSNATNVSSLLVNSNNLVDAGTVDLSSHTNGSFSLNNCTSLEQIVILNAGVLLDLRETQIAWPVLEQIFNDLPDRSGTTSLTLRCAGIPAVSDPLYDPSSAIAKNWVVDDV